MEVGLAPAHANAVPTPGARSSHWQRLSVFESARRTLGARGSAGNAAGRQFLPARLPAINHNGARLAGIRGPTTLGWGFSAMRIHGPNGTAARVRAGRARAAAPAALSRVSEQEAPRKSAAAGRLRTIRRHRCADRAAGRRGSGRAAAARASSAAAIALDALDELKIGARWRGTLAPATPQPARGRPPTVLKDGSGDAGLDAVLGEIELRVEVEIAKMAPR